MNKTLKFVLIALGIIAFLLSIAVFSFFNAPKASVEQKKIDLSISATELFQAYSENPMASDQKFIDQIVLIKGKIAEISSDQKGAPVLLLETSADEAGVLCTLEMSEKEKISGKKVGELITVKGVCAGMLFEVVLNRCTLME